MNVQYVTHLDSWQISNTLRKTMCSIIDTKIDYIKIDTKIDYIKIDTKYNNQ